MALTRPIAGQEISATDFGQPVYDAVVTTVWTAPTLLNSWQNFAGGWQVTQYRKVGDRVEIRGMVKLGLANQPIFVLPVGFRPLSNLYFAGDSYGQHAPIVALTNGNFLAEVVPNNANLSFNNIYFSVTA